MHELDLRAGGYLIDLDGTLIAGQALLPDACWLMREVAGRFVIVSNNAEHTPRQLARHLSSLGLMVPAERIVLAGTCAIDDIAQTFPGCGLMVIGSSSLKAYARSRGLRTDAAKPDVVLVARDRTFTYRKLEASAAALSAGARLYVAAPDLSHPGRVGCPVPETGALAAAVIACSGIKAHRVIGKPERPLFEIASRQLKAEFKDLLMIGDNPETDGLGATRLGMRFHPVRQGLIRPVSLPAAG